MASKGSSDAVEDFVSEIRNDNSVKRRRFDKRDWLYIAEFVIEEYHRRKHERRDREHQWSEIDRQVAMEPDVSFKLMPNGQIDIYKAWMSEMELPLQAQTLEVVTADCRKMMFPDSGPWFRAHAEMTDDYLRKVDFKSLILGDKMQVPSQINQDNANKLVESFLNAQFRQYDLPMRCDRINAEAIKYGVGVGRARIETKSVITDEARGSFKTTKKLPVLHPTSIKNTYIDDALPTMHSAQMLAPAHISVDFMKLENLAVAMSRGSDNPHDEDGGWIAGAAAELKADDKGYVTVLEMEGDIIVPRKTTRSFVLHNCIVTVALGGPREAGSKELTKAAIRFRFRKSQWSSYLLWPYHYEGSDDHYPTSPLMKGRPLQMMATDALNRLMDSAALKNNPPIGYNKDDMVFAQDGGPRLYPGAQWETVDPIRVYNEVGGDPKALADTLTLALNMYANLTGILPGRLGAQTVSHTTAFAKDAEMQRGATRTVDYVTQSGQGPMTRWLDMSYQMGRDILSPSEKVDFFIPAYGGYVTVTKAMLPEKAQFEWFGSGGPAEEQQKTQVKIGSLQLAIKMDQVAVASGEPKSLNMPGAIKEVLRDGGWVDLDQIVLPPASTQPQLALPPPGGQPGAPGAPGGGAPSVIPQAVAESLRELHQPGGALPPT
jgi:hypothetical protein